MGHLSVPGADGRVRAGGATLGLLVAIDGDDVGRTARLDALNRECASVGCTARSQHDAVAVLVPTWSVDTWGLFFARGRVIPEHLKSKHKARGLFAGRHRGFLAPGVPVDDAPRLWKAKPLAALTSGFLAGPSHPDLPSLDAARGELDRWR